MMYEFQPQHRLSKELSSCIKGVWNTHSGPDLCPNGIAACLVGLVGPEVPIELELQFPQISVIQGS